VSELRDVLGGCDRASLEMHFYTVIERIGRCNWRPRTSELRDTLCSRDGASFDMHLLQATIVRDWRSTWRWSILRPSMGGTQGAQTLLNG
jgi:hypothetical protein